MDSPPTITPETPVAEAARYLRRPGVSALPVLDGGAVVGDVTGSDLVALVAETDDRPSVRTIMPTPVTTIAPSAAASEAAERMRDGGIKHLPVVEDGCYRGVLSVSTLAPYLPPYALDTEWQAEPIRVGSTDRRGATAGD